MEEYMRRLSLIAIGLVISVLTVSVDVNAKEWADLQPGDTLYFLLPASADQPVPGITETLVFTGGKIIDIDIGSCGGGVHPVQHYTLVDTTGRKSAKSGGIIPLSNDPVRPGTRIANPLVDSGCSIGGVDYIRYQGTVE
jgi:hypothetical protein